jgi:hypothetical protein
MLKPYDFSKYFSSPEILASKFLEYCFREKPAVYPINPFRVLKEMDIPFVFRDFKMYEYSGAWILVKSVLAFSWL